MLWVVLITAIAAFFQKMTYPLWPCISPDSWTNWTFEYLKGNPGMQLGDRVIIYPGIILLLIKIFGSFKSIVIAQHIISILTGLMLYFSWTKSARFIIKSQNFFGQIFIEFIGYLLMTSYIFSKTIFTYSLITQPEIVSNLMAIVYVYLLGNLFLTEKKQPSTSVLSLFIFIAMLLPLVKEQFAFTIFLSIGSILSKLPKSKQLLGLILALLFISIVYLPIGKNGAKENAFSRHLFASNSATIYAWICTDLEKDTYKAPQELMLYKAMKQKFDTIFQSTPYFYSTLGFHLDAVMFNDCNQNNISVIEMINRHFNYNSQAVSHFELSCFISALYTHPAIFLKKMAKQFCIIYADHFTQRKIPIFNNSIAIGFTLNQQPTFQTGVEYTEKRLRMEPLLLKNTVCQELLKNINCWNNFYDKDIFQPFNISFIFKIFENLRIASIYSLLIILGMLPFYKKNIPTNIKKGITYGLLLIIFGILINLTSALFNSLDNARYQVLQLSTNLFMVPYLLLVEIYFIISLIASPKKRSRS